MQPTTDELIRFLDAWQPRRIAVLGDFMLDRYSYGNADRLSPDAPVPVLAIQREEHKPGGAANVCLDLRALRCNVTCLGVVGDDVAGRALQDELKKSGCDSDGLVPSADRPTTIKHSYIGLAQHRHPQKMFRVDHELKAPIGAEAEDRLIEAVKAALAETDVLCIEDYAKGVCTPRVCQAAIKAANEAGVPVYVDPAASEDYSRYAGATCITPNRTEAGLALGRSLSDDIDDVQAGAKELVDSLSLQAIVLTLDKQGALVMERGSDGVIAPTRARNVYDVTGAGDMVLAMLATARANDASWLQATALANVAAGLEVERFGVVPIELDEILMALLLAAHESLGKVRKLEQLLPELAAYRKQGKTVALTNGCFDILHAGHVTLLRKAAATADVLVLAVNTDVSISSLKGPSRPIVPLEDRLIVLSELACVDYIITFGDGAGGENDTPLPLIREIRPDVLIKGGDYKPEQVVGRDIVESYGGQLALISLVEGRSTTNIVERIRSENAT